MLRILLEQYPLKLLSFNIVANISLELCKYIERGISFILSAKNGIFTDMRTKIQKISFPKVTG